jgi:hypothetical protein
VKVLLYEHDPLMTMLYTQIEAADLFGEEHLAIYGTEIPAELVTEFLEAKSRYYAVCKKLKKIREEV